MRRFVLAVPGLVALMMVVGCGGTAPIPVEGVVLLDEQPLAGATVTFTPIGKGGQPAFGLTDDGGAFKLTNGDGRNGAIPGEYKVTVSRAAARELPGGEPPSPAEIDKMMRQGKNKNRAGGAPKKQASGIPAQYNGPDTPLRQTVPPDGKVVFKLQSKGSGK